ncbi:helix-turn-helix domain-containing protein [Intrasporangium sp.]|uniref:helix-turn-helix domain-containing protein n=1 Tax=Intrasporangium sp. TaxID=1925024 RepID=UPI0029395EEC|nr:helix-turn-helix domain-containing protein [Intrasporangium sp.]MDV3221913.1 helix-turn-helix domain-containing protein [Intrasporangium sp.]
MEQPAAWDEIVALIESVSSTPRVLTEAVDEVRSTSRTMATLDAADVARRTRDLMTAATRAIAARRGATEAELAFVEDLAITRARQGIPIAEVLAAIHVASRRIWAEAGTLARELGVDSGLLLQARELYDDWAESVRQRLIAAHRTSAAEAGLAHRDRGDRDDELVRRLLQGGSAAVLAAQEAGFASDVVHVGVARGVKDVGSVRSWARGSGIVGLDDGMVVLVSTREPRASGVVVETMGVAGPGEVRELPLLRRLAASATTAATALGRSGAVHVADVAPVVALLERPDLGATLTDRHGQAVATLGPHREAILDTVRLWLERGKDANDAARAAYVHPNTVRNRVASLCSATGLDPTDTFQAVALWWLCRELGTSVET